MGPVGSHPCPVHLLGMSLVGRISSHALRTLVLIISNLGQDANIDQGNTLHSGIPPDYWGGAAGPSSSGPQMYEAFDRESMIMQQEIERLEAQIARSRSRMADLVRNHPNLPFGTSGSALTGSTSDIQSSDTYIGKGKGRAV
jgi:hypothetical protein